MNDKAAIRARLIDRRHELQSLSAMSADARAAVTLDQQSVGRLSRMDAMQAQAMAQATERQREIEIMRLTAALQRLEEDEYGMCVQCGEDIAEKRLEIDPAASHCIKCAR
ncbi:MAG: molecular chaperone DnaK [Hyphomicrobiales bacterium]|nr:MAG: molecular chaperone DnaK [Hyphomicrobiales bacterium]